MARDSIQVHGGGIERKTMRALVSGILCKLLPAYRISVELQAVINPAPHELIDSTSRSRVEIATNDDCNSHLLNVFIVCFELSD